MTFLDNLFLVDQFEQEVEQGYVSLRYHPSYNLSIANYTPKAQYENRWNPVTRQCRGLIFDNQHGQVFARPFEKFFNHNQNEAPSIALSEPVEVSNKEDGSMISVFRNPDGAMEAASRGSFVSDQAIAATEILHSRYDHIMFPPTRTFLFEYVSPANRIVLDYGGLTDLILIGSVSIQYGDIKGPSESKRLLGWTGLAAEEFHFRSFGELLDEPARPNTEGYVVRAGNRVVKIKEADYLVLHKLRFNTTPLNIWENLVAGNSIEDIVAPLPDEFADEIKGTAAMLVNAYVDTLKEVVAEYDTVKDIADRKEFASAVAGLLHRPAMFSLKDGRNIDSYIWKLVRPHANEVVQNQKSMVE